MRDMKEVYNLGVDWIFENQWCEQVVKANLSSLPWAHVQLVEYDCRLHYDLGETEHIVYHDLKQFLYLLHFIVSVLNSIKFKEAGGLGYILKFILNKGVNPLSKFVHYLSERVMLELKMLVKREELSFVLVWYRIEWESN